MYLVLYLFVLSRNSREILQPPFISHPPRYSTTPISPVFPYSETMAAF